MQTTLSISFEKYAAEKPKTYFSLLLVREMCAKLVVRLLATAALWVRIQTSLKNTKWAT
jgi:hypothetical protein